MLAAVASQPGGPEVLEILDLETPSPGPGQVLIRVASAGVNRADIRQREGGHPPAPGVTDILGIEASGTIVEIGDGEVSWSIGDSVCALLGGGGYAEYVIADAAHVLPIPSGMSTTDAGGIVEVAATVWANIFRSDPPQKGSWILFHGGTSGISSFGTQLSVALGYKVITTCGSSEKVAASLRLGATLSFNYKTENFAEELKARGIKVARVLDHVGGTYISDDISILDLDGRISSIGNMSGGVAVIDLAALTRIRGTISAASLRARTLEDKADIIQGLLRVVWPLYENGELRPTTFATFPLSEARDAHILMESSAHIGKIVLLP
jgi:putative PIG3 family NAD(P)H quinone oxidoreductase